MNGLDSTRCELAILGLALCTIAVVVALARSRASTERRLATVRASWDDSFAQVVAQIAACEARWTGQGDAITGAPPEANDEEIAACLESLRGLADSLRSSPRRPALAGGEAAAVAEQAYGGQRMPAETSLDAEEQDKI